MAEWGAESVPGAPRPDAVTLIEGTAFCVCSASGNIDPGGTDGIFFRDTRLVSTWELLVDGEQVEPIRVISAEPYCATFLGLGHPRPGRRDGTLLVQRTRYVGDGMREDIAIHNYSDEPAALQIALRVESDLAGIFDVKAHRARDWGERTVEAAREGLIISSRLHHRMRGVRISAEAATPSPGGFALVAVVEPRDVWRTTVLVLPIIDGQELPPRFPPRQPVTETDPARRHHAWEQQSPAVSTRHQGLARALRQSRADLGSLRIFDAEHPDLPAAIAAGAPWFMTIFGRDSLIASWMALPLDQSLALGTVRVLADLQGERADPLTEEEPGKIIHELRHGTDAIADLDGAGPDGAAYFGSVDATPLFVMLLGELWRWGLPATALDELLPHADRALQWIEKYGDLDGDGFVEYKRKTDRGLFNQGWKDSFDGINFADGTLAQPPIALAEVQAYVYAAYLARAGIARSRGDAGVAEHYSDRAEDLKKAFNEAFWLPDQGWYAVGLDRDKRPIDALASNMGHCLLTRIADPGKAAIVADKLMSPEMFTGWGVRTLASSMGAYNPMSYHNGSVWPHDNALIAAGLIRYGFVRPAQRITLSLLEAADAFGGRLPELFCGFDRAEYSEPLPYPTSCSPQAWAAATPLYLLRTLLRFDPCLPCGKVWLSPALPPEFGEVQIDRLSLSGRTVSLRASDGDFQVNGLPPEVELIREPLRPPTAAQAIQGHP